MPVLKGRKLNARAWKITVGLPIPVDNGSGGPTGGTGGGTGGGAGGGTGATGGSSTAVLTSTTAFDASRVFNRDAYTGAPIGYTTTYNKGWGNVPVTIKSSTPLTALFMRLHDVDGAAQQAVVGTGAVIQPPALVPGITSITTSAATYQVPVPARAGWNYLDLAADAAFTNPIRIPIAFGVGAVFFVGPTVSLGAGFTQDWDYAGTGQTVPPIDQISAISPFGVVYAPSQTTGGGALIANTWQQPGNASGANASPYDTAFAAEYLRLCINQLGVNCALVGGTTRGGFSTIFQPNDLAPTHFWGQMYYPITHADVKGEGQLSCLGSNDAGVQTGWPLREFTERLIFDRIKSQNPIQDAFAIGTVGQVFDTDDGSSHWKYYWGAERELELTRANHAYYDWYDAGATSFSPPGGHPAMLAQWRYARGFYRYAMGLMGARKGGFAFRRGPKLVSATRSGVTITLTVQHDGGTALRKYGWFEGTNAQATAITETDTSGFPDACVASMFSVYLTGKMFKSGKLPLGGSKVVITNPSPGTSLVQLILATDPGAGVAVDVYHGLDFYRVGDGQSTTYAPTNGFVILTDDTSDGDGITYGRPMRRTIDAIYCPAPTPAAQAITLIQPLSAVPGSWLYVKFTGAGASFYNAGMGMFSSSVEVTTDAATYAVPDSLVIQNDNKGYFLLRVPKTATVGSTLTITARLVADHTVNSTITTTVVSARGSIPDPDGAGLPNAAVVNYDVMNIGTMFSDVAKTTQASLIGPVRVITDSLGSTGNDLAVDVAATSPSSAARTDPLAAPLLLPRKVSWSASIEDWTYERPYLCFGYNVAPDVLPQRLINVNAPGAAQMMRDCAMLFVADFPGGSSNGNGVCMSIGRWAPPQAWNSGQNINVYGDANGPKFLRNENTTVNMTAVATTRTLATTDYLIMSWVDATKTMTYYSRTAPAGVSSTNVNVTSAGPLWNAIFLASGLDQIHFANVKFQQCILFNRALSANEAGGLMTWAQSKWPWGT